MVTVLGGQRSIKKAVQRNNSMFAYRSLPKYLISSLWCLCRYGNALWPVMDFAHLDVLGVGLFYDMEEAKFRNSVIHGSGNQPL